MVCLRLGQADEHFLRHVFGLGMARYSPREKRNKGWPEFPAQAFQIRGSFRSHP
jgi:hypothetical protein